MKEYICIEAPNEVEGGMIVFKRELIRCKDCGNWKKPTDEGIGECVMLSKVACYRCRTIANFFCAMAETKVK